MISRVHCTFSFHKTLNGWILYDGGLNQKASSNGVWILIDSKHIIGSNSSKNDQHQNFLPSDKSKVKNEGNETFIRFLNYTFKIESS